MNLCVLELDHMNELNQEGAAEICRDGLQQLHTLSFISTPVTAKAILHFTSEQHTVHHQNSYQTLTQTLEMI